MSVRRTITYVTVGAGIVVAAVGLLLVGRASTWHAAQQCFAVGIALMAGGGIYSFAMDDAEARAKALGTGHHEGDGRQIDLTTRDRVPNQVDTGVTI